MALSNKIDNYESISAETELAEKIKEKKLEEKEVAVNVIKGLDTEKLSILVGSELKNNNGAWLKYNDMKKKSFYPFMVQASIDLLSDKLTDKENEKKFDKNGNESKTGKSLDEWLKEKGGIDNVYGNGTNQLVRMVQNILDIHIDGGAGPEFFANVMAKLNGIVINEVRIDGINKVENFPYTKVSSKLEVNENDIIQKLNLTNAGIKYNNSVDVYINKADRPLCIYFFKDKKIEKFDGNNIQTYNGETRTSIDLEDKNTLKELYNQVKYNNMFSPVIDTNKWVGTEQDNNRFNFNEDMYKY